MDEKDEYDFIAKSWENIMKRPDTHPKSIWPNRLDVLFEFARLSVCVAAAAALISLARLVA